MKAKSTWLSGHQKIHNVLAQKLSLISSGFTRKANRKPVLSNLKNLTDGVIANNFSGTKPGGETNDIGPCLDGEFNV